MRISDWSSDVCSSDLSGLSVEAKWTAPDGVTVGELRHPAPALLELVGLASYVHKGAYTPLTDLQLDGDIAPSTAIRSDERPVGKECVSTCRSRWSQNHYNKKEKSDRSMLYHEVT